jgi:uncharacterized membrane protein
MNVPSALYFRLVCCGAYVRQPVSRERWPARGRRSVQQRRLVRRRGRTKGAGWPLAWGVYFYWRVVGRALGVGVTATAGSAYD